jgi:hypothetical protein
MKVRHYAAITFLVAAACNRSRTVWTGQTMLGPRGLSLTFSEPLLAPGPFHHVCIVPTSEDVRTDWDSLVLSKGQGTKLHVVLTTPSGGRDSLWSPAAWQPRRDSAGRRDSVFVPAQPPAVLSEGAEACVWHDAGEDSTRVYTRLELRTDRPVEIRAVTWWSGHHTGLP